MRILVEVTLPHEPFNTYVREGTVGAKLGGVLEEIRPEAIYFTEHDGQRGAIAIHDLATSDRVPSVAEPWFLVFGARCRFNIAMTPEDIKKAELEQLGKRWG